MAEATSGPASKVFLNVAELKALLKDAGGAVTGNRSELAARLASMPTSPAGNAADPPAEADGAAAAAHANAAHATDAVGAADAQGGAADAQGTANATLLDPEALVCDLRNEHLPPGLKITAAKAKMLSEQWRTCYELALATDTLLRDAIDDKVVSKVSLPWLKVACGLEAAAASLPLLDCRCCCCLAAPQRREFEPREGSASGTRSPISTPSRT